MHFKGPFWFFVVNGPRQGRCKTSLVGGGGGLDGLQIYKIKKLLPEILKFAVTTSGIHFVNLTLYIIRNFYFNMIITDIPNSFIKSVYWDGQRI